MLRRTPIVVILGSTATGKTKLSIELANRFNGEIISADSMQIYKGLDISTAKATTEERSKAVHHMLDICDVKRKSYNVVDYRDTALPKIDNLLTNNKCPIIVGGTTYYIETLLWKVLISSNKMPNDDSKKALNVSAVNLSKTMDDSMSKDEIFQRLNPYISKNADPNDMHGLLSQVDPITAQGLHPNNVRKIRRALEVFVQTGRPMSDILTEQKAHTGSSYLGGPMRYQHTIFLWIKCDQAKLNARIDKRIDSMINDGMLFEIRECYNLLKHDGIDPTKGIMQAIGFKEFLPYLEQYSDESVDTEITQFIRENGGLSGQKKFIIKNRISDALKLLETCLDELRLHTKQYSKKQIKWIRNRMVSTKGRPMPHIYVLDSTNAETNWHTNVYSKAENVIQSYIDNVETYVQPAEKMEHPTANLNMHVTHFCDVCNRRFVGDLDYNVHITSNTHKKAIEKQRKVMIAKNTQRSILIHVLSNIWNYFDHIRAQISTFIWRK